MIKLKNNILTRDPVPEFLQGLQPESLRNLSWTDPKLGVSDSAWLPEVDQSPALQQYQRYGAETLTLGDNVAIVTRAVMPWTAAEIAADLTVKVASAIRKIDADADRVYGDVVGNKGEEYRSAEADAKAFVAAGYTGVAGSGVTSWATAKGWTTTQAANDIIVQATAWRGAQALIRAQRLGKKEAIKAAIDSAAIDVHMGQWAAFVTGIRAQLGVP